MKNIAMFAVRLLAISVLLAPFTLGQAALDGYATTGTVLTMTSKHINIDDIFMKLSPTVKVVVPGKKKASLSDIKPGDNVGIKLLKFQGKSYVDTIFYLGGSDSTANE